ASKTSPHYTICYSIRFTFKLIVLFADLEFGLLAAWLTVLLQRVDKLVCDEVTARLCVRLIIAGCEDDVRADRVRQSIDGTRALRSAGVRVYANSSEV